MKTLLVACVLLGVAACGQSAETATVTVHVANQAGVPLAGTPVNVQRMFSAQQTAAVDPVLTTDADGQVSVELPVNAVAQVGLGEGVPRWQKPFVVADTDFEVWYRYGVDIPCSVVDPTSDTSCPSPSPSPSLATPSP